MTNVKLSLSEKVAGLDSLQLQENTGQLSKLKKDVNKTTTSVDIESQDVKKSLTPDWRERFDTELHIQSVKTNEYGITEMFPIDDEGRMLVPDVSDLKAFIAQLLEEQATRHAMLMAGLEAQIEQNAVIRASELVDKKLEEQKAEYARMVEELFGNNNVYLLPPGVKNVYGYSKDKKTRISAMYITNEVALLTQKKEDK